jgi:predicted transcriptional regulator
MPKEPPSLGELEVRVLREVWRSQPCTERQIWDQLRDERPVGRTTVLKTIQRLEAKELLVRVKGQDPVQYRAAADEKRLLPAIVRRFVDKALAGSLEPLIACLADSEKLSAKDIAALKAIAQRVSEKENRK